jgi:hypothetical protein
MEVRLLAPRFKGRFLASGVKPDGGTFRNCSTMGVAVTVAANGPADKGQKNADLSWIN